jgi:hypothetical protein
MIIEVLANVAFILLAVVANPDSAPITSAPAPSGRELSEIQARFTFRSEARISRTGVRSFVSDPRFGPAGIDYREVIGEDGWPAAQSLPRPLSWAEIDTLWRRNSRAGIGAVIGAVVVAIPAGAWGHDRWPAREDAFLTVATATVGATVGGLFGATVGSAWFTWELVRPAQAPSPGRGPAP